MKIGILKDSETMRYAAQELAKYIPMVDCSVNCEIICGTGDITLGILSQLGLCDSDVDDPVIDDVIDIRVDALRGHIAGSNERSVLMGVYNYLKSAGCMWVRPGVDGEYIPRADLHTHACAFRKKADLAFRGECIEGAVSYENVRDTILWLPKVNMNLFMMEQIVPYNYMSRWYMHEKSTVKEDEHVSFEEIAGYVAQLEQEIKKCGLQLHALGHGYLLEPYGIHYKRFDTGYELPEWAKEDVALVDGKRELYHGSPNFTQLCFSKDAARLGLVKFLVEYLEKKPFIDFLHVWLSDAANNHCECEACRKKIPTDFYVQMLNELDAELTARGIGTKIVFIMYVDTFWPPEVTTLLNPDRFIMTTAPVRNYSETYRFDRSKEPLPPFKRNDFHMPSDFSVALKFMDAWKTAFDGRRFLFEYYMYTDHFFDPGYMSISRNILQDIRAIDKNDFDGILSDQTQRSFFPTGLPMCILGEGQFDRSLDFDAYADRYFRAAYGEDAEAVRAYLEEITARFDPVQLRVKDSVVAQDTQTGEGVVINATWNNPAAAERLAAIPAAVEPFRAVIERNLQQEDSCRETSWKVLRYHSEYCIRLSKILSTFASGDAEGAETLFAEMMDYLSRVEDEIQPQFDLVLFRQRVAQILKNRC